MGQYACRISLPVAYAISRHVGGAVVRNRLRRRLRAIVSARASTMAGAYLLRATAAAPKLSYAALDAEFDRALERLDRLAAQHEASQQ